MGITGLLPIVKKILVNKHIRKYSNTRIAIDGHAWIHQVIPTIATELYFGKPTDKHTKIFMNKINNLLDYGITPVFVFDGDFLPSKEKTFVERREQRGKNKKAVEICLQKNELGKARELMKRCVSVSPEVLISILRILKTNEIEYIISPYEADSQLHFLQLIKYVDYIMTEDSDLIIYGADKILYKFSGTHVDEYDSKNLHLCKDLFFRDNILDICILSGCDYLDSIKGVGLITAHKKLQEVGDVKGFVDYMISLGKTVPNNYLELFNNARQAFIHHIVYNPITKKRQFLSDPAVAHDFLGTLEDSPYSFHNNSFDRHFCPNDKSKSLTCEKNDDSELMSPFNLESDILSPYF